MKVGVVGLGYVGTATAACLAAMGHDVQAVEIDLNKLALFQAGRSPIAEPRIPELLSAGIASARLTVGSDTKTAAASTDVTLVCVGTPSLADGSPDLEPLRRASEDIGQGLAASAGTRSRHTVVYRSTILPGTCERELIPLLEASSGLQAGRDFGVAVCPAFVREGACVEDFYHPARLVIGQLDEASGAAVARVFASVDAPVFCVPLATAEMTKYADNALHAVKISFANELAAVARSQGVDVAVLTEILLADRKLNLSDAYLRPGFAFGGSCLPKDLRALDHCAALAGISTPLLSHVLESNAEQVRRAVAAVQRSGARTVGVFGLAFKPGTDDLRESALVELCRALVELGVEVRVRDPAVAVSALLGANLAYAEARLPQLQQLLRQDAEEVVRDADAVVVGAYDEDVLVVLETVGGIPIIDLTGLPAGHPSRIQEGYVGLAI